MLDSRFRITSHTGSEVTAGSRVDFPALEELLKAEIMPKVRPSQISESLTHGIQLLASVRDGLQALCNEPSVDGQAAEFAACVLKDFESGNIQSFDQLASDIARLEDSVSAREPDVLATIAQCKALVAASVQDNIQAAEICEKASRIPGLTSTQIWYFLHQQAKNISEHGRNSDDEYMLQSSVDLLRVQVLPFAEQFGCAENEAVSLETLGDVLAMFGQRRRGTRYLEDAIEAFQKSLKLYDDDKHPNELADLHNRLGNALGALGQRSADENLLQRSIEQFEQALLFRSEENSASSWASIMNNMAAVLLSHGGKANDPKMLKRSVEAYKDVLRVWTRNSKPFEWAATMNNLGTALRALGEHRRGPRTLRQSVAAFESALAERIQSEYPEEWALTHNNLGAALQKLAQREDSSEFMLKATESYENALEYWTSEKAPMTWAMTMANLGVARRELAEMTGSLQTARKAVEEIQSAVDTFRAASHSKYTELGEEQLSKGRQLVEVLVSEGVNTHC